ncbi:MAG: ROK family protein [Thermoguttaceae bacterium]
MAPRPIMPETRSLITTKEVQGPFFAGIDLGGTNIKVGVVDDLGRTLSWLSIPTEVENGPEDAARRMGAAVHQAIRDAGLERGVVARVGLGAPGGMDIPSGMLTTVINLGGWDDFPIRDRVSHHCGLPVTFENDANAAAYGEFWVGSGREFASMVLLTLGTGIGCGIIIGDAVIQGAHSHGGEAGHVIIDSRDDARMCNCGWRGHLEAYASATAVIKRGEELINAGRASSLQRRLAAGEELTPKLIAEEAEAGDPLSLEIVLETARYLGIGTVNVMHVVDPDVVLLGGAMTFGGAERPLGRRFLDRVRQEVRRLARPIPAAKTVIDFASLGGDAGFIGAAGVARLDYLRSRVKTS